MRGNASDSRKKLEADINDFVDNCISMPPMEDSKNIDRGYYV